VRQTLFVIPETLYGYPVFGFGILLLIWAVVCAGIFAYQMKQNGLKADMLGFLPVMILVAVIVGFVLPWVSSAMQGGGGPAGLPIRGYGVMLLLAMVSGAGLAGYRARTMGVDPEIIFSLAFAMIVSGIAGARVFFVIQYWDQFVRPTAGETMAALLSVTNGGLVVYGSVIGGLAAATGLLWYRKIPLLPIADIIAPSMVLGLALGRVGCLLNGCCYGGTCEAPWPRLEFPPGSPAFGHQRATGEIRGFHYSSGDDGAPVVDFVKPGSEADKAGLKEGDQIANLRPPMLTLLTPVWNARSLRGAKVRIETAEGFKGVLTVRPSASKATLNDLGFDIETNRSVIVSRVDPASEAYKGGLRNNDRLEVIVLQGVQTKQQVHDILAYTAGSYTLTTGAGKKIRFGATLPDRSLAVHPTQIYSAISAALLAAFLWFLYPFRRRDGEIFATLLCIYPVTRILLEMIRTDVEGLGGSDITISQAVSFCFLLVGGALWIYLATRPTGSVLPPAQPPAAANAA